MRLRKSKAEVKLVYSEKGVLEDIKIHYFQVDFLKAAMIFLVIFDHMVDWSIKSFIGVSLWERISIPVFLVLMGFNMGLSFKRRGVTTLKEIYSKKYFKSKIKRYIVPFLILYGVSTLIGLIIYGFNWSNMYSNQLAPHAGIINIFTGYFIFWGPGTWFIPVLLQSILVIPLLYIGFIKSSKLTLILCFIIEISLQLIVYTFLGERPLPTWEAYYILTVFMSSIPFYLSAVGLGMWFSFDHNLRSKRNIFIWILFPISLVYLIAYQFFGFRFNVYGFFLTGDYNFLVFPYSAFLVLVVLELLPRNPQGKIPRAISVIGKSTFHILLTQILGYGIITALRGTHYLIGTGFTIFDLTNLISAWLLFIPAGIVWYYIDNEKNLPRRLLYQITFFIVFVLFLLIIFIGYNILFN